MGVIEIDTHELAWAAGFFDGEGTCYTHVYPSGLVQIRFTIQQNERTTLDRFAKAVEVGKVNGPYQSKALQVWGSEKKPFFQYRASRREHLEHLVEMLWPYLSQPKRDQINRAIEKRDKGE